MPRLTAVSQQDFVPTIAIAIKCSLDKEDNCVCAAQNVAQYNSYTTVDNYRRLLVTKASISLVPYINSQRPYTVCGLIISINVWFLKASC